jgi:short-subunit dehydrogenase
MKLKYLLAASVVSLAATTTFVATPAFAQETTSSVRGEVVDQNGTPIPGATVTVTHTPSGTTSTQTTDAAGGFNASGLRLGGPFTVSVTADNYETAEQEIGFLTAGQAQRISVALADAGKTIVVSWQLHQLRIGMARQMPQEQQRFGCSLTLSLCLLLTYLRGYDAITNTICTRRWQA